MAEGHPSLVMVQGPQPGEHYDLSDTRVTTIGRSSRNSIQVPTPTISRFHCEVACVNGRWIISDLNSRKGTVVNGAPVEDKVVLRPGDLIRMSTTVFRFEVPRESVAEMSALPREELAAEERRLSVPLAVNAAFLAVVVVVVAFGVSFALRYAQRARTAPRERGPVVGPQTQQLYRDGMDDLEEGRLREALGKLQQVARRYPQTPLGRRAERRRKSALWGAVERVFNRITEYETEGEYADALAQCRALAELSLSPEAGRLLDRRRHYTVRLAHAAYDGIERRAAGLLEEGRRDAAVELYAQARGRLGVPDLVAAAVARLAQLRDSE